MIPWRTAGDRCGPQQAWQCLECVASVGSQTFDVTAYKTAVKTAAGDEYFVFAIVVNQTEPGSADNGTASEALTCLRGFKAIALSQRGRRAGGTSQGCGVDWNFDLDAQDLILSTSDIRSIRELSPEEEASLREHTATGKGGKVGHYLVPKGVHEADGRTEHFNRFLGRDARGRSLPNFDFNSEAERAWRAKQLRDLYTERMREGVRNGITASSERTAFDQALPKVADVLVSITQAADAPSDLAWDGQGADPAVFVTGLRTGLPRCVREHLQEPFQPRPPETKRSRAATGDEKAGGTSSSSGGKKSKSLANRETIPTVDDHEAKLVADVQSLTGQVFELQSRYELDMRTMMDSFSSLHGKYRQAIAIMNSRLPDREKELALAVLGSDGKWVTQPPPFDPGSRPFVERAKVKRSAGKSGLMSSGVEKRPPPSEFAVARKFEPEEYTDEELVKLNRDLFSHMPKA